MNCMKCGQETVDEHVFCEKCLAVMEKYPVRPGAVVMLPRRREPSVIKKLRRDTYRPRKSRSESCASAS